MAHIWLTVITSLPDDKIIATQAVLDAMGNPAKGEALAGLTKTRCVHFAAMVIIPGDSATPAHLVLELSGDGPKKKLLAALDEHAGASLREAFQHTREYRSREKFTEFLARQHQEPGMGIFAGMSGRSAGLNFTGTPGASVEQILLERDLAKDLTKELSGKTYDTALETVNRARAKIRAMAKYADWLEPASVTDWNREEIPVGFFTVLAMVISAVYYFLWVPLLVFFIGVLHLAREALFYEDVNGSKIDPLKSYLAGWPDWSVYLAELLRSVTVGVVLAAALAGLIFIARRWPIRLLFSALLLAIVFAVLWVAFPGMLPDVVNRLPRLVSFDEFPWPLVVDISVLLLLAAVALVAAVYAALRRLENRDQANDPDPDQKKIAAIMARENHTMQNHMMGISIMKRGRLRELVLRAAFWLIGELAQRSFQPGFLAEIGTIHFARWIRLPGTNRLLFFSNYGGSWESYLEDFITKASEGLTAIWSNTLDYPETRNLIQDGAQDGDRFKRWARRQMVPTPFWFSAYPQLRTENIRRNADIRKGLAMAMTENEAEDWLMMFGSKPRPATYIEGDDIQKLVFGGMKRLPAAAAVVVSVPEAPGVNPSAWLNGELDAGHLSFGEGQPDPAKGSTMVAFTAHGLRKFGLRDVELSSFPPVFQSGMTAPHRARVLGDLEQNLPDGWDWGGSKTKQEGNPPNDPSKPLDAILLVYAETAAKLDVMLEALQERLGNNGLHRSHIVRMRVLPEVDVSGQAKQVSTEPFGFVDGISQPIIRGTARARVDVHPMHLIEPGEIVLGYPDNRGFMPPTPRVAAIGDPGGILHEVKPGGKTKTIANVDLGGSMSRDFGRNGTFLVVRQLQQNVKDFEDFLSSAALQLMTQNSSEPASGLVPDPQLREWVAAKMIGRWRNGSPLVTRPDKPSFSEPKLEEPAENSAGETKVLRGKEGVMDLEKADLSNTFLYGTGDPQGLRCPYGAHIRRAFPRESQRPGQDEQIDIVKRHRILRTGRPYLDKENRKEGLLFMCLNADIERQFEFIQQTWLNSTTFHGLNYESDPIMGVELDDAGAEEIAGAKEDAGAKKRKTGRFTIPTAQGPKVIHGLSNFVHVIGGGYFFMPSRRALQFLARRH